jgi:hypothetical protein
LIAWISVAALLLPVVVAIWTIPGFTTQDGPTHLYNAWILARSFDAESPYEPYYLVQWRLLPNWAGHLALASLLRVLDPWTADRLIMTVVLAGFACAIVWVRLLVCGATAIPGACLLAAILALNFPWLLGFTSFLLGCCVCLITLGVWWAGRDRLGPTRLTALGCLLILGYFCHLVSLGLTVLGLLVLSLFAPAEDESSLPTRARLARLGRTALGCLPLVLLGISYVRIAREGGPMHLVWENLDDPFSLSAWASRVGWVDPLTLARKDILPFTDRTHRIFAVFSPFFWLAVAGALWVAAGIVAGRARDSGPKGHSSTTQAAGAKRHDVHSRGRGVWLALGLVLLLAGFAGPDSVGLAHGGYLPQRLELLGLAVLVPALDLKLEKTWSRAVGTCLFIALGLQTAIVWDYALYSDKTAGQIMRAGDLLGRNQRIATLLIRIRCPFRANPVLHADGWLGVGTGNILWSNYEARYYYFPVRFRPGMEHPDPHDFEHVAITTDPRPTEMGLRLWNQILSEHHRSIDRVVAWRSDPLLDEITERWYEPVARRGEICVFARRRLSPVPPAGS